MNTNHDNRKNNGHRDALTGSDLWTDGLICAFEFVRGHRKMFQAKPGTRIQYAERVGNRFQRGGGGEGGFPDKLFQKCDSNRQEGQTGQCGVEEELPRSFWRPIGWTRLSELVQTVQVGSGWELHNDDPIDEEDEATVAELAAPYWERAVGPTWWCHVDASHQTVASWLSNAQWLHPAISVALRDESKLMSERMKHLLYEVPVRVAGGLLFELLGQSAGDPFIEEDDIPVVLRSWQTQNFLATALHVKGSAANINVLGIVEVQVLFLLDCIEVSCHSVTESSEGLAILRLVRGIFWLKIYVLFSQEMLIAGGARSPRTIHELIAHLACRLARWDDRLFRKYIFGAADEVELKFMNRRMHEDLHLFTIILNQEIRRLSTQVIRVKWSLHAREEIVFELLQQLKGNTTKDLLEGIRKSTRDMIDEQEAVRGRLFTIQDVMQSTVRAWLQDRSLTVTHNLGIFGGVGLVLTIITGLFGINVDGIPGAQQSPYAFTLFSGILFFSGFVLILIALLYLGLKEPKTEENAEIRKLELNELVRMFQREAESHAKVRKNVPQNIEYTPTRGLLQDGDGYVLIG